MGKKEILETIIKLSADTDNKDKSLKLLRDLLMQDTNGGLLYKYRRFDKEDNNLSIIKNQTMRCSRPQDFNDPFDCRIGVDLQSIIDVMCGREVQSLQSLFDEYVLVVKGEKSLNDYDSSDRIAIEALLSNDTYNSLINNKSKVSDDEVTKCIREHPEIIRAIMEPLLEISGVKEKLPLTAAQVEGVTKKIINKEIVSLSDKQIGLTDFLKANGIKSDVDQISMAKMWAEGLNDPKLSKSAEQIDVFLKNLEEQIQEKLNETFYVGCLAADYKNRLMWSHYADEHRGFCIEFDFSRVSDDCLPMPVIYSDERVKIPWAPTNDPSKEQIQFITESFMKALLTKDSVWKYEHEWRMLIRAGQDRFVNMPPVSCVYIGALCSEENKQKLITIAEDRGIPLKQMVLDRGEYELHAVTI